MRARDLSKEEEATLKEIIRSVDKKLDFKVRDGENVGEQNLALQLSRQRWQHIVVVSIDDLTAAKTDLVCRNKIRQKIKRSRDHMWDGELEKDVLGTKTAKMLKESGQVGERPRFDFMRRSPRGR
jgi:hypothetical protein